MKKFYRCRWDKKIAGICGGLGYFFKIDPTIIRIAIAALCIFTGILPVLVAYLIAWILMPEGPSVYIQFPCKKLYRSRIDKKIAGICGGISKFTNLDSTLIRILLIVLMLITGIIPIIILYIIGIIIIPEKL